MKGTPASGLPSFWRSVPGQRFKDRYWRHREGRGERSMFVRVVSLAAGAVLGVIGLLLLVLPGPGILFLAMAGALFASESLTIARVLDWIEVDVRAAWAWLRRRFRRAPGPQRPPSNGTRS